jgi:hypothetical protein
MSLKSHRLFGSRLNGPRVIHTYSRDGLNAKLTSNRLARQVSCLPQLAQSMRTFSRVFHMQCNRGGARPSDRLYSCTDGPSGPSQTSRKAAGQMDLLTVPSSDGVDMGFRQDVQALLTSSGDR